MSLSIEDWFERGGGEFVSSFAEIVRRLAHIRAFVFDWDGVFNDGVKGEGASSLWSEADSMGQNLLRFGWWLRDGGHLPPVAVLTGQDNPSAVQLAERERFHAVYQGFLDKSAALRHFLRANELEAHEVAFLYDDALDIAVARQVGLRFLIRRAASPLFRRFAVNEGACDYVTGREGGQHAVREVAELMLGMSGLYERAVSERSAFGEAYAAYLEERQAQDVELFRAKDGGVEMTER